MADEYAPSGSRTPQGFAVDDSAAAFADARAGYTDDERLLVGLAESVSRWAHREQRGKAGEPYTPHPSRVAIRVAGDAEAEAVAWLHDTVEDTPITLDTLRGLGLPDRVVRAVDALTRRPGEGDAYYARVAADPLALAVKHADIADNSDPYRRAQLDPATADRLDRKYAHAEQVLARLAATNDALHALDGLRPAADAVHPGPSAPTERQSRVSRAAGPARTTPGRCAE